MPEGGESYCMFVQLFFSAFYAPCGGRQAASSLFTLHSSPLILVCLKHDTKSMDWPSGVAENGSSPDPSEAAREAPWRNLQLHTGYGRPSHPWAIDPVVKRGRHSLSPKPEQLPGPRARIYKAGIKEKPDGTIFLCSH